MNIENRMSKLEAKIVSDNDFKVFRAMGDSEEECQAAIDRLIAGGEARPTDHFFGATRGASHRCRRPLRRSRPIWLRRPRPQKPQPLADALREWLDAAGIEPADPMIHFRNKTYPVSYERRH